MYQFILLTFFFAKRNWMILFLILSKLLVNLGWIYILFLKENFVFEWDEWGFVQMVLKGCLILSRKNFSSLSRFVPSRSHCIVYVASSAVNELVFTRWLLHCKPCPLITSHAYHHWQLSYARKYFKSYA